MEEDRFMDVGFSSVRAGASLAVRAAAVITLLSAISSPGPAPAATIELCADTTGTSPCPLPGTSNPAGDTIRVLPANTVNHDVASPGPAYMNPGVIEVQSGGNFNNTGWGFIRTTGSGSFDNSGTVFNDAFLQVEDGATIENRSGAVLTSDVDVSIYDNAVLNNDGRIDNYGYIYTLIDIGTAPTINNSGEIHNYAYAEIVNDGIVNNSGTLIVDQDAAFDSTGQLNNTGLFVNDGAVYATVYDAGGGTILNSGDFLVSATGLVDRSGSTRPYGTYTQTAGTTAVDGQMKLASVDIEGGSLTGVGAIQGTVRIGDGTGATASVAPGSASDETAALQITGSLEFESDGELVIEIGGASDLDQLLVSGASILDGALIALLQGAYEPDLGETFTFLTAASVSGGFASTSFPVFDGRTFELFVDPSSSAWLEVVVVPEPSILPLTLGGLLGLALARRRATPAG
jgi:hypothetical protein